MAAACGWCCAIRCSPCWSSWRRVICSTSISTSRSPRASSRSRTPAASSGGIRADQSISFQADAPEVPAVHRDRARPDPAIESVAGFTGGFQTNSGFMFADAEAAGRARRVGRPGDRAAAAQARPGAGRHALPAGRCRTSASAAARAMRSTSSPCRPTRSPDLYTWATEADPGAAGSDTSVHHRRRFRPAAARPAAQPHHRSRRGEPARRIDAQHFGDALRRLRPAPGLDRSTMRSTSITWSWRSRRNGGRTPSR